jgi:beta-lactamase superfamily II metal-dependent hydrolase
MFMRNHLFTEDGAPLCPSLRRLIAAFAAIILLAACATAQPRQSADDKVLRIIQLNVGQGDAALVVTPENKRILIDAGPNDRHVLSYLRQLNIDTLDLVVSSHNHADHIGGMPAVFIVASVRAYLDNGLPHTTNIYQRTLAAVEAEPGLQYLQATQRSIRVGSVTLRVLPPSMLDNSQNNNSVGLLIEYGEFRGLYTGDSEQPQLENWLRAGLVPRVTLVKAAHHGSWNGVTPDYIEATAPKVVLISVGRNSYGHPAPAVEQQWARAGAKVYRTDLLGTIEIRALATGKFSLLTSR